MNFKDFSKLNDHDVITTSRRLLVDQGVRGTYLTDTLSGQEFYVPKGSDQGTLRFEVTEPAKKEYKVGDVVEGDDYRNLPVGTVVEGDAGRGTWFRLDCAAWAETCGDRAPDRQLLDPRVIKYLPS